MRRKWLFGAVVILSIISSCSTTVSKRAEGVKTLDLSSIESDTSSVGLLSEIADSVCYIKLSDEVMLDKISGIFVRKDGSFMLYSNQVVYGFDSKGGFINQLFFKGRGPNEANCFWGPINNPDREFILTDDNFGYKYKRYSHNGEYLGERPGRIYDSTGKFIKNNIPVGYLGDYEISYDNYDEAPNHETLNPDGEFLMTVRDIRSDSAVYRMPNRMAEYKVTRGPSTRRFGSNYNIFCGRIGDELWFNRRYMDTVYATKDFVDVYPKYVINLGKDALGYKQSVDLGWMIGDFNNIDNTTKKTTMMIISERYMILFLMLKNHENAAIIYDIKNDSGIGVSEWITNDIDNSANIELYPMMSAGLCEDNKLYYPVDAYKLVGKQGFEDLTDDSNPVIMVVYLKR